MLFPSIEALTIGNSRRACAAATVTNGRNVNENPLRAWNSPFARSRSFAIFVISMRCTVVTCADVCFEKIMCSANFLRIVDIGSTRVFAASARGMGGGACGAGGAWGGAYGVGAGGGGAAGAAAWLTVRAPWDAI